MDSPPTPDVSVVIPVFNEERILRSAVEELTDALRARDISFELVLAENGSTDDTREIANALCAECEEVRVRQTPEPNYGRALRDGILDARGEIVVCEEIDLCDLDFFANALTLLDAEDLDLVVGSKAMAGADDARPWTRRAGTVALNTLLRWTLGFRGTDTHGLKAFRRRSLIPIAEACITDRDIFASEFVIRAERAGLATREIPVQVREKRPPTVGLARRVPNVLRNLARLVIAVRVRR